MAGVLAGVLARRGVSALVFRGEDGLDELTTTTTSRVWLSQAGTVTELQLDPLDLELPRAQPADLRGGDASVNAGVARAVLAAERGPVRDAVLLNAAAALVAYQPTDGSLVEQLAAVLPRVAEAIDSGAAAALLDQWVASTRERAKQS
jgi:anthranilate phosphoribosyltransferase